MCKIPVCFFALHFIDNIDIIHVDNAIIIKLVEEFGSSLDHRELWITICQYFENEMQQGPPTKPPNFISCKRIGLN